MKFSKQDITIGLIQFLISVFVFSLWHGQQKELWTLVTILIIVNLFAILLGHFTLLYFQKGGIKITLLVNLVLAAAFLIIGGLLREYLTFEIVENIQNDASSDNGAIIVASRIVQYGGKEFMMLYFAHFMISFVYHRFYQSTSPSEPSGQDVLKIKNGAKVHFLPVETIEWIEAAGNYVEIYGNGEKTTSRTSITSLLNEIQSDSLRRIHRSFIINTKMIRELIPKGDGSAVILNSGREIKIGRQYKNDLFQYLGIKE